MSTNQAEDWKRMRRKIIRMVNQLRKGPQRDLGIDRWAPLQLKARRFTRRDWLAERL